MPRLGPLAAYLPTPRDDNGRLLTKTFESLLERAVAEGVNAVGVLGSTGGLVYVPRSARKRVIKTAVEVADGRVPVVAGVGAFTLAEVLTGIEEAQSAGADGLLVPPVSYQPLTNEEVSAFYRDVVSRSDVGIWVYNNPDATHYRFGVDDLARLGRMNGVAGFKDRAATAAQARGRRQRVQQALSPRTAKRLQHGFSGDAIGAEILIDGAPTWHSGLAGVLPRLAVIITRAVHGGDHSRARLLQQQLMPVSVLAAQYGTIRVAHSVGELLGARMGTLPRPLLPLPQDARTILRLALRSIDLQGPDAAVASQPTPASAKEAPAVEGSAVLRERGARRHAATGGHAEPGGRPARGRHQVR